MKIPNIKISERNPVSTSREDTFVDFSFPASLSTDGTFCATVKDIEMAEVAQRLSFPDSVAKCPSRSGFQLQSKTLEGVTHGLRLLAQAWLEPDVRIERVIRYCVASHVSFAEGSDGQIYPNAGFADARWDEDGRYGKHHSTNPAQGGYSLIMGARAYDKRIITRGSAQKIEYVSVSTNSAGLQRTDPLYLLNSWCSFTLPDVCQEMPYTPEAALFFHRMLMGMAELSRNIQNFMHDDSRLLAAINNGANLLGFSPANSKEQAE